MSLEIGKMLYAKPRVSANMRAHCHKHVVNFVVSTKSCLLVAEGAAHD